MIFSNSSRKLSCKNYAPLHWAVEYNLKDIVELLISKGADVNAIDIIYQIIMFLFFIILI